MAESENLIPTSYRNSDEAIKMAGQVRRATVIVQEYSGQWKLLVINNRYKLADDLQNMDLGENDGYVNINDTFGSVQRAKVQLNPEDLIYFAKIIGDYIGAENPISLNFNNAAQRIRSLITVQKSEEKPAPQEDEDRTGLYEVQPLEFYCYFKRFNPSALIIEQEVGVDSYNSFGLYLTVKDKNSLDIVAPVFRKSKKDLNEAYNHLSKNKPIELKLTLKPKILEMTKYRMYQTENINIMLKLKNPMEKGILNNISNYILEEVKYL